MSDTAIDIIIQGGAVGLALVSLGLTWYCVRVIANHLVHTVEVLTRLTDVVDKLVDRVDNLPRRRN